MSCGDGDSGDAGNTLLSLDSRGRDLMSGVNYGEALSAEHTSPIALYFVNGRALIVTTSADRKYHLLVIAPPPMAPTRMNRHLFCWRWRSRFSAGFCRLALLCLCTALPPSSIDLAKGTCKCGLIRKGRMNSGISARSIDGMADRIETLLTAERRLLQDVSHELRSPLARLSFAAELMRNAANPDEALDRVRREIVRLSQILDSLIEVTRVEGDPSSRETQRFSLTSLMQEVMKDCVIEAEARNVAISGQIDYVLQFYGNPELVRRAVENVLRNAIRFSPEGSSICGGGTGFLPASQSQSAIMGRGCRKSC